MSAVENTSLWRCAGGKMMVMEIDHLVFKRERGRCQESNVVDSCTILHQEELFCHSRGEGKHVFEMHLNWLAGRFSINSNCNSS